MLTADCPTFPLSVAKNHNFSDGVSKKWKGGSQTHRLEPDYSSSQRFCAALAQNMLKAPDEQMKCFWKNKKKQKQPEGN